ncbi:MAG: alcohol dehydrogenase catalytic domain-containing protein [Maricaulaceae bacterium]
MTLPTHMRAFVLTGHGEMNKLVYREDYPVPQINADEVLIKVAACGLNNTDVNTRTGWYSKAVDGATTGDALGNEDEDACWGGTPLTFPRVQGADVVGHVVAVGANGDPNVMGKRVMIDGWLRDWDAPEVKDGVGFYGSECDGGFADYAKADYRNVHTVESDLSDAELATFACSWMTAEGMLNRANVGAEDTVLITGASGGVGSALISLAARRGAKTIAITSRGKRDKVAALNPTDIILREDNLTEALAGRKVSVVADLVAGDVFPELINALSRGGRYVASGAIAGPITQLDIRTLYLHDLTLLGSTVVPAGTFDDLVSYIEKGEIKPALAASYPLKELKAAQQAFIDKKHVGNIVVTMR